MKITKQQLKQIVEEELATLTDGIMDTEEEKARKQHMQRMKRHPQTKLDKQLRDRERKRRIDREFEEPSESEHDGYGGTRRAVGWSEGKLTKQQLEQIIREELLPLLSEVDPFSPEGQRGARRVPTQVTGPAQIIQVKNGESLPLAKVEAGESVTIRFDEE